MEHVAINIESMKDWQKRWKIEYQQKDDGMRKSVRERERERKKNWTLELKKRKTRRECADNIRAEESWIEIEVADTHC